MREFVIVLFMVNMLLGAIVGPATAKTAGQQEIIVVSQEDCKIGQFYAYEELISSYEKAKNADAFNAACAKMRESKKEPLFKPWGEMSPEELEHFKNIILAGKQQQEERKNYKDVFLSSDRKIWK